MNVAVILIALGAIGFCTVWILRIVQSGHAEDVQKLEAIREMARLDDLYREARRLNPNGPALTALETLYIHRARLLEVARTRHLDDMIRGCVADRIALAREIARLTVLSAEQVSSAEPVSVAGGAA